MAAVLHLVTDQDTTELALSLELRELHTARAALDADLRYASARNRGPLARELAETDDAIADLQQHLDDLRHAPAAS